MIQFSRKSSSAIKNFLMHIIKKSLLLRCNSILEAQFASILKMHRVKAKTNNLSLSASATRVKSSFLIAGDYGIITLLRKVEVCV